MGTRQSWASTVSDVVLTAVRAKGHRKVADGVRIGTRGSRLALRQAETLAEALRGAWPGLALEVVPIRTSGDRLATAHLADVGGKGLFVREIDEALLDGRIEIAVHSLKDLPAERPRGLVLAAFLPREDPRDVLVSREGGGLAALRRGACVGTSSERRRVQLLAHRPDLQVEPIRGNVDTRLRKLDEGPYDGIVLAAAGLRRLGLEPAGAVVLSPEEMLPAVGQGTLGVETRADDGATRRLVAALDHAVTRTAALAERAFLGTIGGSCTTPLAAYARPAGESLRIDAFLASPDGARILRDGDVGEASAPAELGRRLARRMLGAGAAAIIRGGAVA